MNSSKHITSDQQQLLANITKQYNDDSSKVSQITQSFEQNLDFSKPNANELQTTVKNIRGQYLAAIEPIASPLRDLALSEKKIKLYQNTIQSLKGLGLDDKDENIQNSNNDLATTEEKKIASLKRLTNPQAMNILNTAMSRFSTAINSMQNSSPAKNSDSKDATIEKLTDTVSTLQKQVSELTRQVQTIQNTYKEQMDQLMQRLAALESQQPHHNPQETVSSTSSSSLGAGSFFSKHSPGVLPEEVSTSPRMGISSSSSSTQ